MTILNAENPAHAAAAGPHDFRLTWPQQLLEAWASFGSS